jgi:hypothetical protein
MAPRGSMKRFLKEYAIEIIAVGIILFGFFLMFEQLQIRNALMTVVTSVINAILSGLGIIITGVINRLAILTISDALGIVLILLAAGLIVWRIRYRFHTDKRWETDLCPKCSSPIMRVHRNGWDRLLGATFLPEARRYRCGNAECGWSGLLRRHIRHHHHRTEKVSGIENN